MIQVVSVTSTAPARGRPCPALHPSHPPVRRAVPVSYRSLVHPPHVHGRPSYRPIVVPHCPVRHRVLCHVVSHCPFSVPHSHYPSSWSSTVVRRTMIVSAVRSAAHLLSASIGGRACLRDQVAHQVVQMGEVVARVRVADGGHRRAQRRPGVIAPQAQQIGVVGMTSHLIPRPAASRRGLSCPFLACAGDSMRAPRYRSVNASLKAGACRVNGRRTGTDRRFRERRSNHR